MSQGVTCLAWHHDVKEKYGSLKEKYLQGEYWITQRKTCASATLFTKYIICMNPGLNFDIHPHLFYVHMSVTNSQIKETVSTKKSFHLMWLGKIIIVDFENNVKSVDCVCVCVCLCVCVCVCVCVLVQNLEFFIVTIVDSTVLQRTEWD